LFFPSPFSELLTINPTHNPMNDVIIIGSGPAGLTAAIYLSRAELKPLLIAGSLPGGQLTQTTDIENYPGFKDPINGFELMFNMQKQAEHFGTEIKNETVASVNFKNGGPQEVTLTSGETLTGKAVIIATGASPRWLGLESEQRLMNKGVTACATCDGAFYKDVPVVVVGGGDTAMEEALFLTRFASSVTIIHRRDQLRASKIMGERALKHPKIEVAWNSVVEEVLGDDAVEGVKIKNVKTGEFSVIDCKGYFVALGHVPATELFKDYIDTDNHGYLDLKTNSSYTNIDGVFAAGDCADSVYRQAISAAGMGCRAAIDTERWLEAAEQ
jgi:thioredoxin reductase (NADPH)